MQDTIQPVPALLWKPTSTFKDQSIMHDYMIWLERNYQLGFDGYKSLWEWSVEDISTFWKSVLEYFKIDYSGTYTNVLKLPDNGGMIGAKWFDGIQLNYAEQVFKNKTESHPAIIFKSELEAIKTVSWNELEINVGSIQNFLKSVCDVEVGDRVVAVLPNNVHAVEAFLATNASGAIWSSCSPDFGASSIIERFSQIEPKVLFISDGYIYNGKKFDKKDLIEELKQALPSLNKIVIIPTLNSEVDIDDSVCISWNEVLKIQVSKPTFNRVNFDHPIWILYSSGTTGKPKAITHGVGGNLIEHMKALGLHQNCKEGERFLWYSTTGWMMWNYALSSLLMGATLVVYDGSAGYPDLEELWKFVQDAGVNHFGCGAAFYIQCMKSGINPNKFDLGKLISLGSTGSPLTPDAFKWIYEHVKKDVWLASLSGGTDVCSGFVGGSPLLPVYEGEIQCRMLGCAVEAFDEKGNPVYEELGELVITKPMPSMPVKFWNDLNNEKYYSSYFDVYSNIWRHGDWTKITHRGSVIIYGRSDATLNRGGIRIGTSEVYNAVESIDEILDSMVICLDKEDGDQYMPLFVVLKEGVEIDDVFSKKVASTIRQKYSPRHVPDKLFAVNEIPYTLSGKKMEAPVKKILMGISIDKAASVDAMKNPHALDYFVQWTKENKY